MEKNPWFRALIILAVFALAIYLGGQLWEMARHFADIIIVFFLAWLVAFILSPLAYFLERGYRLPRSLAVALVYLGLFVNIGIVFVLVVPLAVEQLVQLAQYLPSYVGEVQTWLQGWGGFLQAELSNRGIAVDMPSFYKSTELTTQVGALTSGIVANTITLVSGAASFLTNATIVLVLSFYLVLDGDRLVRGLTTLVPASYQQESRYLRESISRTFGGWLRGTLLVALVYAIGNAVVMAISGLSYVLLASILAGVLMIIPLFGPVLALVLPVLLAAFQGDVTKLVLVVVGLLILQVLVFNVLSPKVMGESVGMHPLLVFLALLVGIKQAGLVGAIFGVPVIGVAYAMVVYLIQKRVPPDANAEPVLAATASEPTQRTVRGDWVWLRGYGRATLARLAAALGREDKDYDARPDAGD
jgi:predicted PurR-regulated permease PerM